MSTHVRRAARLLAVIALVAATALFSPALTPAANAATGVVTATCAGNTLNVTLQLQGFALGSQVRVRVQAQRSGWAETGLVRMVTTAAGQTVYSVAFDISAFRDASRWRVTSDAAGGYSATSSHIEPSSCAPPTEVPEAPSALLIPVSLAMTAVLAETVRRRRTVFARP